MIVNPKYEGTPVHQKVFCLRHHLRKLCVASSEVRRILVDVEANLVLNEDADIETKSSTTETIVKSVNGEGKAPSVVSEN